MNKTNRSFPAVAYGLFLCHLLAYSLRFIFALYRIDYSLLPCGFVYRFCAMTLPILLWLLSTVSEAFNYHRFKLAAYIATLYYETLIIITVVFQLLSKLFLPSVLAIETDEIFTKGMVLFLARLITEFPLLPQVFDATHTFEGTLKPNWTGMNPFFISPSLSGNALHQAIVKKAVIFSDVMQVITDLKGKADSYFTGLNRQMLANLAILVMNTVPVLYKRQATPADLQLLINNFDLLPPYVSKLDELDREQKRYSFISQYIREDLLGKGRPKMEDQSRGTRNIINEFLLMPESKDVYCAQASIDFDQILENGEITVCNYDLASGDSNAIAFGLFFLLSFNNAVLSRPGTEKTRIPHFFYVDELPVLIHSSLEKNFSLFRKFRVAMFCAIQTLDQFEKNEITKYLKGVILGCAHIFVFGRSSLSDMEVFSAMAGIHDEAEEQSTVSETALSDDSPSLSLFPLYGFIPYPPERAVIFLPLWKSHISPTRHCLLTGSLS